MKSIPLDLARRIVRTRCERFDVELVLPGDPRRDAVLYGMAAAHKALNTGWDLEYAREHVSVTLPGLGPAADLLAAVPYVGGLLRQLATERPAIYFSPGAWEGSGAGLLATALHEEGHVGSIRNGGLAWCICYGALGEVRVAGEAPCFGASTAILVRHGGVSVDEAVRWALDALAHYGTSAEDLAFARGILASVAQTLRVGGDPGGVLADVRSELAAQGWAA